MENPLLGPSKFRLESWKNFRVNELANIFDDLTFIKEVIDFWSKCPISRNFLNWDAPETWLDPWELIHFGEFDRSTITLGMAYTFLLDERWESERIRLNLIDDNGSDIFLILIIDNFYVLNFNYNKIEYFQKIKHIKILESFAYFDKKFKKI